MTLHRSSTSLVELLATKSATLQDRVAFRYLVTGDAAGEAVAVSYRELDTRARRLAARLQSSGKPGERALLLFAPGVDFFTAFFGSLYAATIAVPIYPPDPKRLPQTLPRMQAIAASAGATKILTTRELAANKDALALLAPELAQLEWIAVDELGEGDESAWKTPAIGGDTIAFLQYTSGSTGSPRGVVLTHANVLANQEAVHLAARVDGGYDVGVNWMPVFHDFGLIGSTLHTIFSGATTIFMSPLAFLKDPLRWLRAISHYRGTISGGPDFAFARCAKIAKDADVRALDLSCWRAAINAAEPVRSETIEEFSRVFAPAGFSRDAFMPAYGLAEATLIVTSKPMSEAPKVWRFDRTALEQGTARAGEGSSTSRALVGSGHAQAYRIRIVDPARAVALSNGQVGEIWVRGEGVALGYWDQPELSRETFGAELEGATWLRTGDLGFQLNGELFVTGRLKDLIIVRGRNIYPQDVERAAEAASSALRPGCSAAFSVEHGGEERVALVAEAEGTEEELAEARARVRRAIAETLDVSVEPILFVKPRTIFKTSSGKIQRRACKQAMLDGTLQLADTHRAQPAEKAEASVLNLLCARIIAIAPHVASELRPESTLLALGFDSLQVAQLATELSAALDREVPLEIFFGQTLGEVAKLLEAGEQIVLTPPAAEQLQAMLVPECAASASARGPVLLTGATGFLGRYLLAELLEKTEHDVICLVRAKSAEDGLARVLAALDAIGRRSEGDELRLRAIPGDLREPGLGLSEATRRHLAARLDAIYHSGARVHWSLPYEALRAENVRSVEALLELASVRNIPIHHISSLGVYPLDAAPDRDFREDELAELAALRIGYFQSKWAAEKLLADARARGFRISIYRPGLITGDSKTGYESELEGQLFPAFLRGCIALGKVPDLDKVLDVVPVDYVSAAIVRLALSTEPGGSHNLINPAPMRQPELYRALGEAGYSLREVAYPLWREEVLALPANDPGNPLARFAGYYAGLDPARMAKLELATRSRLPVEDAKTRAALSWLCCPPFDRALLSTYLGAYVERGLLPKPLPATPGKNTAAVPCRLAEDLTRRDERVFELYTRTKQRQWDAAQRIDWSIPLDPENPEAMPDSVLPLYGSAIFDRLNAKERTALRRHYHAWQLSQLMHGEQGALLCAAKLVAACPTLEGRLFAAAQSNDEARHLEIFSRLLTEKLELSYPVTPPLRALLDQIFRDGRWDMTALGMQVLIEGLALATFALVRDQSENPLIRSIHAYVMEDEARHVAFGRMTLKQYYPELTAAERAEREDFVVEASYLLRDRFQSEEVFAALGLPVEACLTHMRESGVLRNFRAALFSRIVPVVRAIGLWGPKVNKAYGAMGVLGFAHVDVDALAAADEQLARSLEKKGAVKMRTAV